jgi:excisionase family DNA binding protein
MQRYLTVAQAAEQIQVSTKTIFRRIEDGSIRAVKLGPKTVRISVDELDRYMQERIKQKDA